MLTFNFQLYSICLLGRPYFEHAKASDEKALAGAIVQVRFCQQKFRIDSIDSFATRTRDLQWQ